MEKLVIIGAGGQGKVVADVAECVGYKEIVYLDDAATQNPKVVGKVCDFEAHIKEADFFVAIGNAAVRESICGQLMSKGAKLVTLVHPAATVSRYAQLGQGVVVMAGAVINAGAIVGDGVIVNTCASVDHDCAVGNYSHVSVGAHVCGTVQIGERVWVGAGATVTNNIQITKDVLIGAGALIIHDLLTAGTYVGVPAKQIK